MSTELFTELSPFFAIFCGVAVIFCIFLYVWMRRLAEYCRDAVEYVRNQNKNAVSLRQIAELDATVTELSDSYSALLTSNKKLRARIGMRATREKRQNEQDLGPAPADEVDRARYKAKLRETAKQTGLLR